MSVLVAILGLALLILIHEMGHFFTARGVGMRPRKFYIGFPPAAVKWTRNGIEYGIGVIPFGGYVKIPGMHRPSPGDVRQSLPAEQQQELAPELNELDAALERGDEPAARAVVARLEPRLPESRQLQELDWALAPDAYWRQKAWKKVVVIAAGPFTNLLLAVVLFVGVFMVSQVKLSRTVDAVIRGKPAATAGLHAGDRIVEVAGHKVTADGISKSINATHGRPFTIVVVRGDHRVTIGPLRARLDQGVYRVGFQIRGVPGPGESLPQACWSAVRLTWSVTSETVKSLVGLFVGNGTRNISSAVGIVRVTSQAARQSIQDYLFVIGLVSLSLALLNLLPVLPLDGGHILISILERIRGRAFSQVAYMRYSAVGLTLFVFLLYLGLRNDFSSGHS
jgi:regulator of sigma E protease